MITIQIQVPNKQFAEVWWRWYVIDGKGLDSGFERFADDVNLNRSGIIQKEDKAMWTIKHENA
jgi:hypothetical protein